MNRKLTLALLAAATALGAATAHADITVGVTLGATGPGASLGIHYKNAFQLMPQTLGGQRVKYIILEDGSDATNAGKNARKLITEDKVDVIMGSNGVPSSLQISQVATETHTPFLCLTPIAVKDDAYKWTFSVPQPTELMMGAVAEHLKANGVKTVGFIGFSDGWGDLMYKATDFHAASHGYKVVTNERYARADTSVTGQVLKIMAANPDAVVVGGSGTGGALPHLALVERGYKGRIYHNHGTVNAEFIRVGGKSVEDAIAPTGPLIVPEELPASHATKKVALAFTQRYEATFGAGSRNAFAGYTHDAVMLLGAAIPAAMKKAKPGTPAFREALRDALEHVKNVVGTHGVYNPTPANHSGLDDRARVLVQVKDGKWRLMK
ncbi:MAG: ABC transporter substrate-binding protein [Betaproteobacteria bacterium]|nr:ABC transporter substrate-binding protein [Betaproteobacteria bacterium]